MGIYTSARLIVGCEFEDFDLEHEGDIQDLIDNEELDYASPYYDSDKEEWVVGVRVRCPILPEEAGVLIACAKEELVEILYVQGIPVPENIRLHVCPHVT